jgi:UDP-N-acetylglucosamine 2-epimerase (non-hydrolysing)
MDHVFFEQLHLPLAKHNLDVGSGTHGKQTGTMLCGIEQVLQEEAPHCTLVQGDTNTVLAGSIAAAKLGIKVGHVEAGLRSFDRRMPEETNRVLADHCSDYLFAPTDTAKKNLQREGLSDSSVFVVGNTVVDAVHQNLKIAKAKNHILKDLAVEEGGFMLATAHRQENVDDPKRFEGIIRGLKLVQEEFHVPMIYPLHPRAKKQLDSFNVDIGNLQLIEPLDYLSFLHLESKAQLVFTDSGGVQEETCILQVPCITLRDNTERPETLEVGSNLLAGTDPRRILEAAKASCSKGKKWPNPFGDGKTGKRIVDILDRKVKRKM